MLIRSRTCRYFYYLSITVMISNAYAPMRMPPLMPGLLAAWKFAAAKSRLLDIDGGKGSILRPRSCNKKHGSTT